MQSRLIEEALRLYHKKNPVWPKGNWIFYSHDDGTVREGLAGGAESDGRWKIHISINPAQMDEAIPVILNHFTRLTTPRGSLKYQNETALTLDHQSSKEFALVFSKAAEQDNKQAILMFLRNLAKDLKSLGIQPEDKLPLTIETFDIVNNSGSEADKSNIESRKYDSKFYTEYTLDNPFFYYRDTNVTILEDFFPDMDREERSQSVTFKMIDDLPPAYKHNPLKKEDWLAKNSLDIRKEIAEHLQTLKIELEGISINKDLKRKKILFLSLLFINLDANKKIGDIDKMIQHIMLSNKLPIKVLDKRTGALVIKLLEFKYLSDEFKLFISDATAQDRKNKPEGSNPSLANYWNNSDIEAKEKIWQQYLTITPPNYSHPYTRESLPAHSSDIVSPSKHQVKPVAWEKQAIFGKISYKCIVGQLKGVSISIENRSEYKFCSILIEGSANNRDLFNLKRQISKYETDNKRYVPSAGLVDDYSVFLFKGGDVSKINNFYKALDILDKIEPLQEHKAEIMRLTSLIDEPEIKKNADALAQAKRTKTGLFNALPSELNVKIAGMTGTSYASQEPQGEKIAKESYSKPRKKN